jgi:amino acid transporter
VPLKEMDFSPAEYFDRVDKEEAEMERENPTPKASFKDKIWELRKAIIG